MHVQTHFTADQLAHADIRDADAILRACVHCGFCLATCPTYVELGDELLGDVDPAVELVDVLAVAPL